MQNVMYVVLGILTGMVIAELLHILSMRKSIREIAEAFHEKLCTDTNTLISVSTSDHEIRKLASRMNQELRQLRRERLKLQQGDQELKNAVTNIAHDLRTPLTAISGYLELLEQEPTDEKVRRYLDVIGERTEALKQLTEELFRYSILLSADDELHPEQCSLNRELEIALTGAYGMLTEKGIQPEISIPEKTVCCLADKKALQRIFGNILTNTAKYSDGDLKVTLTDAGTIIFQNRAAGLSQVETEQLFDRYYTVEIARGSTGLGLSIARLLTERMGGSIKAEWDKGTIRIILEMASDQ
ncbi:MAG: HAMP domain-containing sensor histidine kinase [Lachnospiraceae bacterium]|nr:HAMP domain-containing sensor histidine kinase [Lachnospiraceae bacterium]